MIIYAFLYAGGIYCLIWAAWFAMQQAEQAVYTDRVFADFSGDIQSWLRCESK